MTLDASFSRHMSEADTKQYRPPTVYERRDCVADGSCERPAVTRGMCRRHAVRQVRR